MFNRPALNSRSAIFASNPPIDCSSQASRSSTPRAVDSSQNKLWAAAQHRTVGLLSAIREKIARRPSSDARKSR